MQTILNLEKCKQKAINNLPDNMKVGGDLVVWNLGDLREDMKGLKIQGDLLCMDSTTQNFLPSGVMIGGNLNLSGYAIKKIPENLKIGQGLYLSGSDLHSLSKGLKVGTELHFRTWRAVQIPSDLQVGERVYYNPDLLKPEDFPERLRDKLDDYFEEEW